tara:strand:- start:140 stop:475 length:336 start_codon:yes stop_codon:yes gene_type:complete
VSDTPPEDGYIKFIFSGVEDPEFIIETSFPQNLPLHKCVDFMAQMLFYVHSGTLVEQNASSVLETCTQKGHYELGAMIIQRWHQYEESNAINPSSKAPCVPPSALFPRRMP